MIERARGLILRTRPFTETSLIVHWLTAEAGRLHTVAKGARRPKSPFRGKLDLFYEADLSFVRSRRSGLHTLREVALLQVHAALREDLSRLQQAAYCAALIEQTTETDTPLLTVFALMRDVLDVLSAGTPRPQNIFAFELKLLNELGLNPEFDAARLSQGARRIAAKCVELPWPALQTLKASAAQSRELNLFLQGFLTYHLGKTPPNRGAACGDATPGIE